MERFDLLVSLLLLRLGLPLGGFTWLRPAVAPSLRGDMGLSTSPCLASLLIDRQCRPTEWIFSITMNRWTATQLLYAFLSHWAV
jgi:hypothetical protein